MKPLLPFPIPLNVGTDICQISRIYGILNGPRAMRFVHRILAPDEKSRTDPRLHVLERARRSLQDAKYGKVAAPPRGETHRDIEARDPELWKCAAFIAGRYVPTSQSLISTLTLCRFAAKEAAIKAHPHRQLTFHDVLIERRAVQGERLGSGPPVARIRSADADEADTSARVSISHDGDYATAVCLGWEGAWK